MKMVMIYTDGACSPNPGPGGWAAIVVRPGIGDREFMGCAVATTNNRMEITAAVEGLAMFRPQPYDRVTVVTDSLYLCRGASRWLAKWKARDWRTQTAQEVKNRDLWERLDGLTQTLALRHGVQVEWAWQKGHVGHEYNERCDSLASEACRAAAAELRGR